MKRAISRLTQLTRSRTHLHSAGRGIVLAAAVGVVAGIGAILFHSISQVISHFALGYLAGYEQGGPAGEAEFFEPTGRSLIPWMLLIVPTIGGLITAWLVWKFAPDAEGPGTEAAIDAYHNKRGVIGLNVPFVKMIASAITIGTGGSGGREGPIAQIGAGFGSYLATRLKLSDSERRVLLAAGLGAGIGAIFKAPLAGAIFAVEVLYSDPDFESEALIPSFIATTVAYCVFNVAISLLGGVIGGFDGFTHLFQVQHDIRFREPILLIPLTALVGVMIAASWLYVRCFYSVQWAFKKMALRKWLKPPLGAFCTGALALMFYYAVASLGAAAQHDVLSVMSFGYGFLQKTLAAPDGSGLLITVLLIVGLGKILTTSLTIASGGSGGVFGPSMVIGGCLGAVVGLAFQRFMPGVVHRVDVFVILGMAGFFAAAGKVPVSTLIMVTELTASYELLLPAMWVCALAYLLSRGWTIFDTQVPTRRDSPAHRGDFIIDVLQGLQVRDVLDSASRKFITVPLDMPLREVVRLITGTKQACFPVVDGNGKYYGLFSVNDVRQFLYDADVGELAVVHDLATPGQPLRVDMDLGSAIELFASGAFEELPVVDEADPPALIGLLRRQDVIAAYNAQLMKLRTDHAADE